MPSTDSFTSSAVAVSSGTVGKLTFDIPIDILTPLGFRVRVTRGGITVTKASSFGGSQSALTFPRTRAQALELADALMTAAN
jgi:hypothetical protein